MLSGGQASYKEAAVRWGGGGVQRSSRGPGILEAETT